MNNIRDLDKTMNNLRDLDEAISCQDLLIMIICFIHLYEG